MVMAHGIKPQPWEDSFPRAVINNVKHKPKKSTFSKTEKPNSGTRRIFSPQFKLQVLDSYRQDADCQGNQRATARKYGIHRRQIQKWLQMESSLRSSVKVNDHSSNENDSNNNNKSNDSSSSNNNNIVTEFSVSVLNLSPSRQPGDTRSTGGETCNSNMADSEDEYVNVDEITDSEDSEEALDLSIKFKLNNRVYPGIGDEAYKLIGDEKYKLLGEDYKLIGEEKYKLLGEEGFKLIGEDTHKLIGEEYKTCSPPVWYPLPPCCYPYSWNYCLPSPPSASIYVEKPLPRRQHLPLDFTNYTTYDRHDSLHMYRIHSY